MSQIYLTGETLTDGSIVYNVEIEMRVFAACTLEDAIALAAKFKAAIAEHTNEDVSVMDETLIPGAR